MSTACSIRTYAEDPHHSGPIPLHKGFMPDAVYLDVVRNTNVTCADAVVLLKDRRGRTERKIYLARRAAKPMPGLWVFGGRVPFNASSPAEGLSRVIKREMGLELSSERFVFHSVHLYTWAELAQGPFPGRALGLNHLLVLTKEEMASISLNGEYVPNSFRGYTRSEIAHEIKTNRGHPMLIDLFDAIFPVPRKRKLKKARKS